MVKKYSIVNKRQWLEEFEKGYSESYIASKYHCDLRTLKKGLEEARHELESRAARIEVLKTALLDHQEQLKKKLREIASSLSLPPQDWTVLGWYRGGKSVFEQDGSESGGELLLKEDMIYGLLKEHLKQDVIWKLLAAWEKAYASHRYARIILQKKIACILENTTGLKLNEKPNNELEYLFSCTAGDVFYKKTLKWAFGDKKSEWLDNIKINQDAGEVRYQGTVLAKAPGKEKECGEALVKSFKDMQDLWENIVVVNTFNALEEVSDKASRAVEEILILGVVTGRCHVCKRISS